MKKVFKLFLVILTGFVFVSTLKANANSTLVEMLDGAQIRTKTEELEQGLRFTAKLEEEALGKDHGFYLIYGIPNEDDLASLESFEEGVTEINGKEVFKVPVPGVSQGGEFSVVLTGIPKDSVGYLKQITVLAYVDNDGEELSNTMTRSVYQVAKAMLENEENEDLANSIIGAIDFVTDAQIVYDFTDLEGKGSTYTETTLGELLDDGEYFKSVSELDRVYNGGDSSHFGMLKLGGSNDNGSFVLTLQETVLIKTVVLVANGWVAADKIIVNGETQNLTLMDNDRLVFVLDDETNEITIESNRRALIYKLELYGEEIVVPETEYLDITIDYDIVGKDNDEIKIVKGGSVELADPVKAGFDFLGWFIGEVEYSGGPLNAEVTIKASWDEVIVEEYIDDAAILYDFKGLTGSGAGKDAAFWSDIFANNHFDTVSLATNVYDGNGAGGTYSSTSGLIKFGKSGEAGKLTLVYENDVRIKTLVFYAEGWVSNDKLKVNGQSYDLSITETYGEKIIVTLTVPTNIIAIEFDQRGFLFALGLYGPDVNPVFYEVEFDYNDEETQSTIVEVLSGRKVLKPKDPTKDGNDFVEWQLNGVEFDFDTPITSNITLVAFWEEIDEDADYSGTYETTFSEVGNDKAVDSSVFKNNPEHIFTVTSKDNEASGPAKYFDSGTAVRFYGKAGGKGSSIDFELDERYEIVSVKFIYPSSGQTTGNVTITSGTATLLDGVSKPATATYTFADHPGTNLNNFTIQNTTPSATTQFRLQQIKITIAKVGDNGGGDPTPTKYDVTFNANGGTPVPATQEIEENGKVTEPTNVTKAGHTLEGWYKEVGLTNKWNFDTDTVKSNITLYAKWQEEQQGGDPEPAEPELLYSYNFLDGGSSNSNSYTAGGVETNISYANDNPGGTSGTTAWVANWANLSMTNGTRLGGKAESTENGNPNASIRTNFAYAEVITKVEILGAGTFGTAGNLTNIYLQTSTNGTTWTTVASTTTKTGDLTFDSLNIPAGSYLRIAIALKASSTNSGFNFTGLKVTGYPKA